MKKWIAGVVIATWCAAAAHAYTFVTVTDPTQLRWFTSGDGKIYLRNMYQWNGAFTCGPYCYYIDTSSIEGKNIYAAMLAYIAMGQPFTFGFPNDAASGGVSQCGVP